MMYVIYSYGRRAGDRSGLRSDTDLISPQSYQTVVPSECESGEADSDVCKRSYLCTIVSLA